MPDDTAPAAGDSAQPSNPGPAPAAAAPASAAAPAPAGDTVKVRLVHAPGSSFATGIEGVPVITTDPTPVPAGSVEAVTDAATSHGLTIIIEEGD